MPWLGCNLRGVIRITTAVGRKVYYRAKAKYPWVLCWLLVGLRLGIATGGGRDALE